VKTNSLTVSHCIYTGSDMEFEISEHLEMKCECDDEPRIGMFFII